ncbi:MAG: STAS domain-containing protein, partial [Bacillota bacterium]
MEYYQHILIVRPAGELDLAVADQWRNLLDDALRRHGAKNLIIN